LLEIFKGLRKYLNSGGGGTIFNLKEYQASLLPNLSSFLNPILFQLEFREIDNAALEGCFDKCLKELKRENVKQEMIRLQYEIRELENTKDKERFNELLKVFTGLAGEL